MAHGLGVARAQGRELRAERPQGLGPMISARLRRRAISRAPSCRALPARAARRSALHGRAPLVGPAGAAAQHREQPSEDALASPRGRRPRSGPGVGALTCRPVSGGAARRPRRRGAAAHLARVTGCDHGVSARPRAPGTDALATTALHPAPRTRPTERLRDERAIALEDSGLAPGQSERVGRAWAGACASREVRGFARFRHGRSVLGAAGAGQHRAEHYAQPHEPRGARLDFLPAAGAPRTTLPK